MYYEQMPETKVDSFPVYYSVALPPPKEREPPLHWHEELEILFCRSGEAKVVCNNERMVEAARRNHRLLMVGFCCRFGMDTAIIREYEKQGYIGDIYYAKASYLRRNGNPGGWFSNKQLYIGSHALPDGQPPPGRRLWRHV